MEVAEVVLVEGEDVDFVVEVVGDVDQLFGVVGDEVDRTPRDAGWFVSKDGAIAIGVHVGFGGREGALEQPFFLCPPRCSSLW